MTDTVLVTGGAGYIGSHTAVELLEAGHRVVIADNFCNSSPVALDRIRKIVGEPAGSENLFCCEVDVRDADGMRALLGRYIVDAVIHFAGLKAVGESTDRPLDYYDNNVCGTIDLCRAMAEAGVRKLVFSSSATVYGAEASVPYVETMPRGTPANPYGCSKAMVEQVLTDLAESDDRWRISLLRYFNPIGAHPSGLIGEDPRGIPNNLMPYVSQVAVGKLEQLSIFGRDYPTEDGTCKRDYLHVTDLARGHVQALKHLPDSGVDIFNLGTGTPHSVLEIVRAFEDATGTRVPYRFAARRPGDLPAFWADPGKAERMLNWKASYSLEQMMRDTWRWQSGNPHGFGET